MKIPWSTVLTIAERAADLAPPPYNVVLDFALIIAKGFINDGCDIEGCPHDLEHHLKPADIPHAGKSMFAAREKRVRELTGTDRQSIRELRDRSDADELPGRPYASPESPDADETYDLGEGEG